MQFVEGAALGNGREEIPATLSRRDGVTDVWRSVKRSGSPSRVWPGRAVRENVPEIVIALSKVDLGNS